MTIDFSELDRVFDRIEEATELAIPVAIDAERGQILRRTRSGHDADRLTFPAWASAHENAPATRAQRVKSSAGIHEASGVYSPGQEAKRIDAGLPVDIKDIEFSGATLASLGRYNEHELTVSEDYMPIMVGQMQHPKWSYHHNILGVNIAEDVPVMEDALGRMMQEVIG